MAILQNLLSSKLLINIIFLFAITKIGFSQAPSIHWQKYYGGSDSEFMSNILEAPGGYLIEGGTLSNDGDVSGNHGVDDVWMIFIDTLGSIKWQKCLGGSASEALGKIIITNSNSFIYSGGTASNNGDVLGNHNTGTFDGWLVEFDSIGNIIRQKCFGGSSNEVFNGIIASQDGDFIVWGGTSSNDDDLANTVGHGAGDLWIMKLDSTWNILWQKRYGGSQNESAAKLIKANNNSYIISGYTYSNNGDVTFLHGGCDYWLVKIDSTGDLLWEKTYGGSGYDFCTWNLLNYNNSGFIVGGYTESTDGDVTGNHGYVDNWILFVDSIGGINWSRCYGGAAGDYLYNIYLDLDSGIIISGATNSDSGDVSGNHYGNCLPYPCDDFWILKINNQGNLLWQKCYGGGDGEIARGIITTSNSEYLVVGSGNSTDGDAIGSNYHGNADAWVIKLAQLPNNIQSFKSPLDKNFEGYIFYSDLHLNYIAFAAYKSVLQLYDMTGQLILEKYVELYPGKNQFIFSCGELKNGIYLVRLGNELCKVIKK